MLNYQISITLYVPNCVYSCCVRGEPIQAEVLVLFLLVTLSGSNQRSTWYCTIHDLMSTQFSLFRIHRQSPSDSTYCCVADTLLHRLSGCTKTADIWRWTRDSIAFILRTNFRYFPAIWTIWTKPKHIAVLWILGHIVHCVIDNRGQ